MSLRQRRMVFWGGLAALLVGFLIYAFRPQPVPVDFAEVQRGRLTVTVDEEGETRVRDVFVLSAPVSGRARRIEIEAGDEVVAGVTVVAEIEPVDPSLLDVRSERESEAAVRSAEAEFEFAQRELARQKQLGERGVASGRDLDAAQKAFRTARAALENARAALLARSFEYDRARAQAQRPRKSAGTEAPFIPVHAPVSGRVLRVLRQSAGVVQPGEPLLEIGNPQDLEIVVDLLSADAVRVELGHEVLIEQWGGGQMLHGRVRRVEPYGFTKVSALGIEEQRVNVVIDLSDEPAQWQRLGHGYRVETRIVLWRGEDVVKLPLSALFRASDDAGGQAGSGAGASDAGGGAAERSAASAAWAVFVAVRGRARLRTVSRGRHNGLEVEIQSGLEPGERVVLHPSDRVVDGVRVVPRR